ncbi:MAG: twin-arginine translocase subunit TatC, partial [Planctomycetes bacterium]|nr:twin-arginine translocase subunit TatC [Planctomycetota bacterium]
GIFDAEAYASQWRMAVLVICIVSALLTPADPYSMLFLAGPLCLLYFGGLAMCRWASARDGRQATNANQ